MTSIARIPATSVGAASADAPSAGPATETQPWLDPAVVAARVERGRTAEYTADRLPPSVIQRGAPSYFRTYEQLKGAMYDLQAKYPDLVQVKDIGDTFEKTTGAADRDVLALVLTNRQNTAPKAKVMHTAGLHAREIANPELLMTFGQQLLEGYGRDPEATALLDNREIHLVPMVNADGHAYIERAYAGQPRGDLMKRKNASGAGGAGTDLNRNFPFHWGGAGASSNPRSDTYRGPSAGSEPEVQAVDRYMGEVKPSFYADWHSYSRLNMYPWGDTREKAPHYTGYRALAEKFSTFNHYSPIQSVQLYPTTGTTDDHAYGHHQIPAFAFETGDSFHQTDAQFAETLRQNLPVLQYAAKVAPAPFDLVKGPDALEVLVDPQSREVTARVADTTKGTTRMAAAELVLDPNAAPGSGLPLTARDGAFDSASEVVTGTLEGMPVGDAKRALVYVRARDVEGDWGPLTPQWLGEA